MNFADTKFAKFHTAFSVSRPTRSSLRRRNCHQHFAILMRHCSAVFYFIDVCRWSQLISPAHMWRAWFDRSKPHGRIKASLTRGRVYDFTTLSFARCRCAIRDLALVAITSAATSASLIVCSILSGAIPRRIRLSITFFLRSDLTALLISLASANMSSGIFVIPLHYRVSIYGANPSGVLGTSRSAKFVEQLVSIVLMIPPLEKGGRGDFLCA